jgi:hypothetical protein
MRKLLLIIGIVCMCCIAACSEQSLEPYSGKDLVQFNQTSISYYWEAALNPDANYDTCWIAIQAMGRAVPYAREIKLVQDTAKAYDLVYDHIGNVVDTTWYVIPNQAKVGVNYVPFDDAGLKKYMQIPAGKFQADIPVVMHKDPATTKMQTLRIRLVDTETSKVGDPKYSSCTITIQ